MCSVPMVRSKKNLCAQIKEPSQVESEERKSKFCDIMRTLEPIQYLLTEPAPLTTAPDMLRGRFGKVVTGKNIHKNSFFILTVYH